MEGRSISNYIELSTIACKTKAYIGITHIKFSDAANSVNNIIKPGPTNFHVVQC